MALLNKGITKLSQLNIDVDKGWQDKLGNSKGISNIKELAANMVKGEMLVKGASVIERLPAGPDSYVLTSRGTGKVPTWAPAAGQLKYYFPVLISGSFSQDKVAPNQSRSIEAPVAGLDLEALDNQLALNITRLDPTIVLAKTLQDGLTPNQMVVKNGLYRAETGLQMVVDGAVADDGGVQTDETALAREGTANDMILLPAIPAVNDAYYLGASYRADTFWINIGTAGVGNWTTLVEYYNSDTGDWSASVDEYDNTNQFMAAGLHYIKHSPQANWALTVIQGKNLYWVRIRITAYNNITIQPKGTQAWFEVLV